MLKVGFICSFSNFFLCFSISFNFFLFLSNIFILYSSFNFFSFFSFISNSSSVKLLKSCSLSIILFILSILIILFSFKSSSLSSSFSNSLIGSLYSLFISTKNSVKFGKNLIIVLVCLNPILKIIGSKLTFIAIIDFSLWGNNKNELIFVWKRKPWIILSQILSIV